MSAGWIVAAVLYVMGAGLTHDWIAWAELTGAEPISKRDRLTIVLGWPAAFVLYLIVAVYYDRGEP